VNILPLQFGKHYNQMEMEANYWNESYDEMHLIQIHNCLRMHVKFKQIKHALYQMKRVWILKYYVVPSLHSMLQVSYNTWILDALLLHKSCRFDLTSSSMAWRKSF